VSDGEEHGTEADDETSYLVEIKRSARRRSAAAGEFVRHEGRYREFGSKALAKEWARESSAPGGGVWIQDSVPADPSSADGYLVGGRRSNESGKRSVGGSQVSIDSSAKG
jgi:hypothetical protein